MKSTFLQDIFSTVNQNKYIDKNVVITGGSSGIGFAIAKEFAKLEASAELLRANYQINTVDVCFNFLL